jgi:hypothetical protein
VVACRDDGAVIWADAAAGVKLMCEVHFEVRQSGQSVLKSRERESRSLLQGDVADAGKGHLHLKLVELELIERTYCRCSTPAALGEALKRCARISDFYCS